MKPLLETEKERLLDALEELEGMATRYTEMVKVYDQDAAERLTANLQSASFTVGHFIENLPTTGE
jgi:hypothetical protein